MPDKLHLKNLYAEKNSSIAFRKGEYGGRESAKNCGWLMNQVRTRATYVVPDNNVPGLLCIIWHYNVVECVQECEETGSVVGAKDRVVIGGCRGD